MTQLVKEGILKDIAALQQLCPGAKIPFDVRIPLETYEWPHTIEYIDIDRFLRGFPPVSTLFSRLRDGGKVVTLHFRESILRNILFQIDDG